MISTTDEAVETGDSADAMAEERDYLLGLVANAAIGLAYIENGALIVPRDYLDIEEVAARYAIEVGTLQKWGKKKGPRYSQFIGRRRYYMADLLLWEREGSGDGDSEEVGA